MKYATSTQSLLKYNMNLIEMRTLNTTVSNKTSMKEIVGFRLRANHRPLTLRLHESSRFQSRMACLHTISRKG